MSDNILAYQQRILERILSYHSFSGQEILLDIGSGDGTFSQCFSKHAGMIVGADINFNLNWLRIKRKNIQFLVADVCNLPFVEESFNVVFIKDVLHHVKNHRRALWEIKRVVRREGVVIIVEANRYNPILYLHMTLMKGHQHFTKEYLKNLLIPIFNKCNITSIESHVYPIKSKSFFKFIRILEGLLDKIWFFNEFLSYNIAIAKRLNNG
jgi:ubiquinone/menaquinone biosynthesis C-methylase UbiE